MGFLGSIFGSNNQNQGINNSPQQAQLANTNFGSTLANSLGQAGQVLGQQNNLAQALQAQANGQGVNLGQTQLQSALNQQNQAAAGLIGAQRGLSPQLAARQVLQQNAQNNQGAANQSAQLQQQQQLAAQQQLGGVLGQEGSLANQQVGTLGGLQNQQNALNLSQQQGINQINSSNAQQNAALQQQGTGAGLNILGGLGQGIAKLFSEGGMVPALVSPGEKIIPPGGSADDGGIVPGEAPVDGDSPKNDIVPAKLAPGTMVIPRSVVQGQVADPQAVEKFMAAISGKKSSGYAKVLEAKKKWKGGRA